MFFRRVAPLHVARVILICLSGDGRAKDFRMKSQNSPETFFKLEDFVPSLREEFQATPLDLKKVILAAIPVKNPEEYPLIPEIDRHSLILSDGKNFCFWEANSLQSLFRGNKQPPVLGNYPEAYNDSLLLLDMHALEISRLFGDRRDAEMREVYSILRRRPDGKSLGFVHDYMWQAAAFILGTRPLSQAEFEAIVARLERSCRTFEMGPTSRNYVTALRSTLGQEGGSS